MCGWDSCTGQWNWTTSAARTWGRSVAWASARCSTCAPRASAPPSRTSSPRAPSSWSATCSRTRNLGRTRAATQGLRDPATAQDMLGDGKAVALFERGYREIGLGGRGNPAPAGRQPGRRVLGLRADQPRPGPRPQAGAGALPCRRRRPRPAQAGPRRRSRLPARLARRDAPALRLHRCYFASASASASTPTASRCCATPSPTSDEPATPASHARWASCRTASRRRER